MNSDEANLNLSIYEECNEGSESIFSSDDSEYSADESYEYLINNGKSDDNSLQQTTTENSFFSSTQGLAICETCGRSGIKDAFYAKSKRFCSLACSRSHTQTVKSSSISSTPTPNYISTNSLQYKQSKEKKHGRKISINVKAEPSKTFDWGPYLAHNKAPAAPVNCFPHCPMSDCWDNIEVDMKVEVPNSLVTDSPSTVYWIASVVRLTGYRAVLRYEGFGTDSSEDFSLNFCYDDIHPIGWCASNSHSLVPPPPIQHKYSDWKDHLVKRLTGSHTLPNDFYEKIQREITNIPVKKNMLVEVVDKMCVSQMRVARVDTIVGGRLRLQYTDSTGNDEFWCHSHSPLVHPIGWSQIVGHSIKSSPEYKTESLNKARFNQYSSEDATPEMFPKVKELPPSNQKFQKGMKLEAIDPLNLSTICVATIMKVLRNNYLMIGIDGSMADNGADWFCYHASSPCIFPVGFCEINSLLLTPPKGYKGQFKWFDYLKQTRSLAAPVQLFEKEMPKHGFIPGMKLEAVDLMEPRLVCVAMVTRVVGRLLRVHFDGWESSYDQWIDCESPDIYAVGWCQMNGYHLEGPKDQLQLQNAAQAVLKRKKPKGVTFKGGRKKKKTKFGLSKGDGSEEIERDDDEMFLNVSSVSSTPQLLGLSADPRQLQNVVNGNVILKADSSQPQSPVGVKLPANLKTLTLTVSNTAPSAKLVTQQSLPKLFSIATKTSLVDKSQQLANTKTATLSVVGGGSSQITSNQQQLQRATLSLAAATKSPAQTRLIHGSVPSRGNSASIPNLVHGGRSNASTQNQTGITVVPVLASASPASTTLKVVSAADRGQTATKANLNSADDALPPAQSSLNEKESRAPLQFISSTSVHPESWTVQDVLQFLRVNDCSLYADSFSKKEINGQKFMVLSKEQIVTMTGMKVGPSLKIYDLIQQLKIQVSQQAQQQQLLRLSQPGTPPASTIGTPTTVTTAPPANPPTLNTLTDIDDSTSTTSPH